MVIQTRPLFADILGQAAAAASYMEQLVNQVYRVPDGLRACKRSEISGLAFSILLDRMTLEMLRLL